MKLINGPTKIAEITLVREDGRGWIATLENGETAWVIGDTLETCDCVEGDVLVAALDKHSRHPAPHWHTAWGIPKGVVTLDTVDEALDMLNSEGPCTAGEIGGGNGDILYHGGRVAKFVKFNRNHRMNPETDIFYTVNPDAATVGEWDDE